MKLFKVASALVCLAGLSASASTSNVTATITDTPDAQPWNNGTWTANLESPNAAPTVGGVPVSPLRLSGILSATGVLTGTFTDTNSIDQKGSTWTFVICPNASVPCVHVRDVTIVGASVNLSTVLSAGAKSPRFHASTSAYGYLDVEVLNPSLGDSYYNVTNPCYRQYSLSGWTCGGGSGGTLPGQTSRGTMYFFGDSIMVGSFATSSSLSGAGIMSQDYPGPTQQHAVGGTLQNQIGLSIIQALPTGTDTSLGLPVVVANGGMNDVLTVGNTPGGIANYSAELNAEIAWVELTAIGNETMASNATAVGFAATPALGVAPGAGGTSKTSITQNDTLTFHLTPHSNQVGLTWLATAGTGTFTVSLGGVLQTNACTGTTTFNSFGCNGQAVSNNLAVFRQDFTVPSSAPITMIVTNTAASGAGNPTTIIGADVLPASNAGQPVFMMSGVTKELNDVNSAITAAYDAADSAVVAALAAENVNVYFVDMRGGGAGPGLNSTTDLAASTTACPAQTGNVPQHPNNCGYAHQAETFENQAAANKLNVFYPGLGGKNSSYFGPVTSYTQVVAGGAAAFTGMAWNNNLSLILPTASGWSPLYASFVSPTNGQFAATGMVWDPTANAVSNGLVSSLNSVILHCASTLTAPSGCTRSAFWDANGNQTNLGSLQLGTTVAGTCAAAIRGQFQYTAGATGVKDTVEVCTKSAADAYAWVAIF
jgi:hypothetical protein